MTTHTVTWDHTECEHTTDPDETWCTPRATFSCSAPPTALCRNGCTKCPEEWYLCDGGEACDRERSEQTVDWMDDRPTTPPPPPHPEGRHCTRGHPITPNPDGECYAILNLHLGGTDTDWNDALDLYDDNDKIPDTHDGPITVTNYGADGCMWTYEEEKS